MSDLVPNTVLEILEEAEVPSLPGDVCVMRCVIEKDGVRVESKVSVFESYSKQGTPCLAVYKGTRRPKKRGDMQSFTTYYVLTFRPVEKDSEELKTEAYQLRTLPPAQLVQTGLLAHAS